MKNHIRTIFISFVLLTAFSGLLPAEPDRLTSQEWFAISKNQKMQYVHMAMDRLKDKEIPLARPANEYLIAVSEVFSKNPDRPAISISEILNSIVYTTEPKSREVMDKLISKKKFEKVEIIKV